MRIWGLSETNPAGPGSGDKVNMDTRSWVDKNTIYKTIVGSTAYGTNTPESDIDMKGICVPPIEYYFGGRVFEQQEFSADHTVFSLKKFVHLAQDCNPNIIEMLYTKEEHIILNTVWGESLRANRDMFLSKKARHTFGGYAHAQLQRIKGHRKWIMFKETEPKPEDFVIQKTKLDSTGQKITYDHFQEEQYKGALRHWNQYLEWKRQRNPARAILEEKYGYDCKHAMHLVRLLRMGIEILEHGLVLTYRPDAKELLDIRNGLLGYDDLIAYAEAMDLKLQQLYETSTLPHAPDMEKIDKWLISTTKDYLNEK